MTKSRDASDGGQAPFLELWVAIGRLALAGDLSLDAMRWGCSVLVTVRSLARHGGVKARAAKELGKSRKEVRRLVEGWRETSDGAVLIDELRRRSRTTDGES